MTLMSGSARPPKSAWVYLYSSNHAKRPKRHLSVMEAKTPYTKSLPAFLGYVSPAIATGRMVCSRRQLDFQKKSIMGMYALVPIARQSAGKKSRKNSKTNRYSARFSLDSS